MLLKLIQEGKYTSSQEAYAKIVNELVEVRDDRQYTWAGIAEIAEEDTEKIKLAMESNGMSWVVHQFGGSGLPLSHPKIQQALLTLASMGVPKCDVLAEVGIKQVPLWKKVGLSQEPTVDEVNQTYSIYEAQLAAIQIAANISAARSKWDMVSAQVRSQIESGQVSGEAVLVAVQNLWSN